MTRAPVFGQRREPGEAAHAPQYARPAKPTGAGMPRFLQRRALKVDSQDSPLEREADAVAEQVMRMPEGAGLGSPSAASGADDRPLRRAAEPGTGRSLPPVAAPAVDAALGTRGAPLPTPERAFFEPRLGADLSPVRIHADPSAARAARAIGAKAFAHGPDIYFGAGRFAPHTNAGRRLLAHELAHVVQHGSEQRLLRRAPEDWQPPERQDPRLCMPGPPKIELSRKAGHKTIDKEIEIEYLLVITPGYFCDMRPNTVALLQYQREVWIRSARGHEAILHIDATADLYPPFDPKKSDFQQLRVPAWSSVKWHVQVKYAAGTVGALTHWHTPPEGSNRVPAAVQPLAEYVHLQAPRFAHFGLSPPQQRQSLEEFVERSAQAEIAEERQRAEEWRRRRPSGTGRPASPQDREVVATGEQAGLRERRSTTPAEAVEHAIRPGTDAAQAITEEASQEADDPWYKGLFRALGQIALGLAVLAGVALLVVAAAAAAGVALTAFAAVLIAGAILFTIGFAAAVVHRRGQSAYAGRPGAGIGRAFLDAIGVTGLQEAWSGEDTATGRKLTPGEQTERGILGGVTILSLFLGLRSALRGPPGGVYKRPPLPGARPGLGGRIREAVRGVGGEMIGGVKEGIGRVREWWSELGRADQRPPLPESNWPKEFWPDNMKSLPTPTRTIEVNANSIRSTAPEFVTTTDHPTGAWKWSLYDEASGAKFCEVYVKTARGGPELWLHPKQALLPSGERVVLEPKGFSWTPAALRAARRTFRQLLGRAPQNLSGDLDATNLAIFQKKYAELRTAHPTWSQEAIANQAVRSTPFGKHRLAGGYADLRVQVVRWGTATLPGGPALLDVPVAVRVEALPTANLPPGAPVPVPTPRDEE